VDVRGKAVLVAGGAGNLGGVVAATLLARGARVSIVDVRDPAVVPDGECIAIRADLADDSSVTTALETAVSRFGNISALVNCAGLIHSEPLLNLTNHDRRTHGLATWDVTIRSNLTATFVLGARVAEHMASTRTKGLIVNFSSIAARGNPGQSAYAAAKAGIEAMTAVWARELGPLGIRVVAIAPGFVATASTEAAMTEALLAEIKRRTPLVRLAKPDEIAGAVAFAIENDFITGTTIAVDGGLVL
jgi:3-oxoacyl-[acyl-carrier protein] reductase